MPEMSNTSVAAPLLLRAVLGAISVLFLAVAGLAVRVFLDNTEGNLLLPVAVVFVIAVVGLVRRVMWGCWLTTALLGLLLLFAFFSFIPFGYMDMEPDFVHPFERLLGFPASAGVFIGAIMIVSFMLLWFVYILSKFKALFRNALW